MGGLFFACLIGLAGLDGTASLCFSDGTTAGTKAIYFRSPSAIERLPSRVVAVLSGTSYESLLSFRFDGTLAERLIAGEAYFTVIGGGGGRLLLRQELSQADLVITDGTKAGTKAVTLLSTPPTGSIPVAPQTAREVVGGYVVCAWDQTIPGYAFYKVAPNGSFERLFGTNPVQLVGGDKGILTDDFAMLGNKIIYRDFTRAKGVEVWSYDMGSKTKQLVKDIFPDYVSSGAYPHLKLAQKFVKYGNLVYFAAYNQRGLELWRTDGTAAGTFAIEMGAGADGVIPALDSFLPVGSGKYFWPALETYGALNDRAPKYLSYRRAGTTDGTVAGSREVKVTYQGSPFAMAWDTGWIRIGSWIHLLNSGNEITSNGGSFSAAKSGLFKVNYLTGVATKVAHFLVPEGKPVRYAGKYYFSAADSCDWSYGGFCNNELWVTDGTAAGTKMVKDVFPYRDPTTNGKYGSRPYLITSTEAQ